MDSPRTSRSQSPRSARPASNTSSSGSSRPSRSIASHSGSYDQTDNATQTAVRPQTAKPRASRSRTSSSTSPGGRSNQPGQSARQHRRPVQPYLGDPLPSFGPAPAWIAISRGVALFLGAFLLLNLLGEVLSGMTDSTRWWIHMQPLPPQMANGLLAVCGVSLLAFAFKPDLPRGIRILASLVLLCWAGFLGFTAYQYYLGLKLEQFHSSFPVAFSLHLLAMLAVVFAGLWKRHQHKVNKSRDFFLGIFTVAICLISFPLAQMFCYGHTDHRRPADYIAVFGCRALEDGTPSSSLRNRMLTGIELYQEGLAPTLLLSGGPGEGEFHETAVMRQLALEAGLPESALVIDEQGWDTGDTIFNVKQFLTQQQGMAAPGAASPSVLAVSNFYHLPRIQMVADRAGMEWYTVPANDSTLLEDRTLSLGREVAAYWWYFVEPILPATMIQ
ncbi:hypothetical protein Pla110_03610 [Polystyrenella longa]|uniref:DUF218 domain-containing protein n=1 Tax=Polystyrenella longa TaxID=2528007 RepID=A0A518CHF3_9PLAN|nr:YdcF family protein [Polystyrenella longa]QDU78657.1 hypothetical protein Pla110_03610 [Polystyrenella longa]